MSDNREMNAKYAEIAARLIEREKCLIDIKNSSATIAYLSSDYAKTDKGRIVFGQCEKVADKYKWGIPADFTITLFKPNIEGKSDVVIERILFHELLHVGIEFTAEGEEKYSVIPHDLEDFKECIDRWGTNWTEEKNGTEN